MEADIKIHKTVVVTMTVDEARLLHNQMYASMSGEERYGITAVRELVDALTAAKVQL